jgi:hypothetical protein
MDASRCVVIVRRTRGNSRIVILFLAVNPLGDSSRALEEECKAIERELRMAEGRDDFDFRPKWAITTDDMMRYLNELRPTIIHFRGRDCSTDSQRRGSEFRDTHYENSLVHNGLYVQDAHGKPQCLYARGLKKMVEAGAASARVVVLNACYSGEHADELRTVVDCVVGMTGAISDSAARSFAAAFYRALGNRRSVGNAVEQARAILAAEQISDEQLPCCRTRNGLDAAQIFLSEPSTAPPSEAAARSTAPFLGSLSRSPATSDLRYAPGDSTSSALQPTRFDGRGRYTRGRWSRSRRRHHRERRWSPSQGRRGPCWRCMHVFTRGSPRSCRARPGRAAHRWRHGSTPSARRRP